MNVRDLPLSYLKTVKKTLSTISAMTNDDENVKLVYETKFGINVKDSIKDSKFYFTCDKKPYKKTDKNNDLWSLAFVPSSPEKPNGMFLRTIESSEEILRLYKVWVSYLRAFNEFEKEYNAYYDDLFEETKSDDNEEYDTSYYNTQQQFILLEVLNITKEVLEQDDEKDQELIEEVKYLQNNLQKFNKSETRRRFMNLFSKLKNKSILLLNTIVKKVKEKLEDKLIERGIDAGIIYLLASL